MSRVDVIVPCYRYGHFLAGCVDSVLGQSMGDLRVLIIDDASPDHTGEVAAALAARDGRVEVLRHAVNRGHIATYNEGLAWAAADYVLLLSADDGLMPGALERAVDLMDARSDVVLTHGECAILRSGGEEPAVAAPADGDGWTVATGPAFIKAVCRSAANPVATPTAIGRTAVQKRIGGYRPDLPHAGDMEMWLRFAVEGAVARTGACQAVRRLHGANMSDSYFAAALPDLEQRRLVFDTLFHDHGGQIPDAGRLRALADRALAEEAFWTAAHAFDRSDGTATAALLDFAAALCPALRATPAWRRMTLKRWLGTALWQRVRPLAAGPRR